MTTQKLDDIIIANINHLNDKNKVSLRQLSIEINRSYSYMQKLVTKQITISAQTIESIAEFYHIHPASLLEEDMLKSENTRKINHYFSNIDNSSYDLLLQLAEKLSTTKLINK